MIDMKHPAGEIRDTLPRILVARWRSAVIVHLWKKSVVFKGIEAG
jgi:hypothetical protein